MGAAGALWTYQTWEAGMGKALLWVLVAVIVLMVVGSVVISLLGTLFKLAFYVLVGVIVVGGALYAVGKVRRSIGGTSRRQIR